MEIKGDRPWRVKARLRYYCEFGRNRDRCGTALFNYREICPSISLSFPENVKLAMQYSVNVFFRSGNPGRGINIPTQVPLNAPPRRKSRVREIEREISTRDFTSRFIKDTIILVENR